MPLPPPTHTPNIGDMNYISQIFSWEYNVTKSGVGVVIVVIQT